MRACRVIRENLALTHLSDQARVHQAPVRRALSTLTGPYHLVFVDPPYQDAAAYRVLAELAPAGLIDAHSVLIVEHSSRIPLELPGEPLRLVQERRYGDTAVSLFQMQEGASVGHRGVSGNF
ncbi:MAG: RsmD family RNA methyltransferase, partial [Chloroflexi bacterium]|nr:RsmD family RNA methyltransferase [Chloroflexota bacterium]